MYSITDSGLPSKSDVLTATSSAASTSGTSVRTPMNSTVSSRPSSCASSSSANRRSPSPAISTRSRGNSSASLRLARSSTSSAFCGRSTLTVPITGASGGDPQLGPHVRAGRRRRRRDPVGQEHHVVGIDALDLDHAAAVLARHRDERGRAARDQLAVAEPPQRLALERPRVLVRDDHGDPRHAPDQRCPTCWSRTCARAARRCARGAGSGRAATTPTPASDRCALQAHHPHVGRLQVRQRVRHVALGDRHVEAPARAQRAVEALGVEPRRRLDREALGAAGPQAVDQRHHPQLDHPRALGGHALNIMPQAPAADHSLSSWPPLPSRAAATRTSSPARAASRCPPARSSAPTACAATTST